MKLSGHRLGVKHSVPVLPVGLLRHAEVRFYRHESHSAHEFILLRSGLGRSRAAACFAGGALALDKFKSNEFNVSRTPQSRRAPAPRRCRRGSRTAASGPVPSETRGRLLRWPDPPDAPMLGRLRAPG